MMMSRFLLISSFALLLKSCSTPSADQSSTPSAQLRWRNTGQTIAASILDHRSGDARPLDGVG
jgi:hypothetical protein